MPLHPDPQYYRRQLSGRRTDVRKVFVGLLTFLDGVTESPAGKAEYDSIAIEE
jgi:hypothetical protein